jgi:hypothetical protein
VGGRGTEWIKVLVPPHDVPPPLKGAVQNESERRITMFITKKNYHKALEEQKTALTSEFERKWAERDEGIWRREEENRFREDTSRHFIDLENRVHALEKAAGLVEEKAECPYAPKMSRY